MSRGRGRILKMNEDVRIGSDQMDGTSQREPSSVPGDPFNQKIFTHLHDRVILKPLTRWNEAYKEFPDM